MTEPREIVCLTTTLNIFRAYQIYPKKGEELNPRLGFYVRYVIGCLLASVILFGSSLHLVHTVLVFYVLFYSSCGLFASAPMGPRQLNFTFAKKVNEYNHIDLDLSYVLSMTSGFLLFILFSVNTSSASRMFMFLSDFEKFGKPPKFDKYNNFLNKIGKYHLIYLKITITLFALSSNVFRGGQCRKDNVEKGYKEICGLITNTWLPVDIDFFPVKQLYLCLQFFSTYYVYTLSGTITYMVMESVVHIGVRLDHVKQLFVEVLNDENAEERRKKFNFAVRYHARVLDMERELNTCFSNAMFSHMVLTASIIGCASFGVMQSGSANPFAVCVGWVTGMFFVCLSGQHLTNKSLDVGTAVYDTKWYNVEPAIQRDLVLVLMRCQKPMLLKAGGFGVMNRATTLAVLQASYSYITLLSRGA